MIKTLIYLSCLFILLTLHSCFLFKPVQKTCPAYSINEFSDQFSKDYALHHVADVNEKTKLEITDN